MIILCAGIAIVNQPSKTSLVFQIKGYFSKLLPETPLTNWD